jgi:hypothetical protein
VAAQPSRPDHPQMACRCIGSFYGSNICLLDDSTANEKLPVPSSSCPTLGVLDGLGLAGHMRPSVVVLQLVGTASLDVAATDAIHVWGRVLMPEHVL